MIWWLIASDPWSRFQIVMIGNYVTERALIPGRISVTVSLYNIEALPMVISKYLIDAYCFSPKITL